MLSAAVPVAGMLSEPIGVTANAAGTLTEGDYSYTVNKDAETVTITKYNGTNTAVVIPGTLGGKAVTMIGNRAFENRTSLTSVTIPDSVTAIDSVAFAGCTSLTSITIPDGVTEIADAAFNGCIRLTSVTIPNSVTVIGSDAFGLCTSLTSIAIPNSVTAINYAAFHDCYALTSVTIPCSVTEIGERAFWQCTSLTNVVIPNGVTNIGASAFNSCTSLTSVNYSGTKAKWEAVTIGSSNECLTSAEIICTDGIINKREPTTSDTSDPTTSTPTTSTPATSEPTTSEPTTSEPKEFNPVSIDENLDEETKVVLNGITVTDSNGAFEDGVVMNVSNIEKAGDMFSFDVTFTKDGKEVQPKEKVTVKMPVPEHMKNGEIYVYHYDNNDKATLISSKIEDGFVIFETDSFSTYMLTSKKIDMATPGETDSESSTAVDNNTGSDQKPTGAALAIFPVVLAAGAVIVISKKRK